MVRSIRLSRPLPACDIHLRQVGTVLDVLVPHRPRFASSAPSRRLRRVVPCRRSRHFHPRISIASAPPSPFPEDLDSTPEGSIVVAQVSIQVSISRPFLRFLRLNPSSTFLDVHRPSSLFLAIDVRRGSCGGCPKASRTVRGRLQGQISSEGFPATIAASTDDGIVHLVDRRTCRRDERSLEKDLEGVEGTGGRLGTVGWRLLRRGGWRGAVERRTPHLPPVTRRGGMQVPVRTRREMPEVASRQARP